MSGLDIAAAGMAGLTARATLVLCLALLVTWLARRGSARTLHLFWTTTFVALLALPALSLLGPSWSVPILPVRDVETRGESVVMAVGEASARRTARETPGSAIPPGSPRRMEGSKASPGSHTAALSGSQPQASDIPAPTPSAIAFLIWALGCGVALTSLVVGGLRFRKLVREADRVRDAAWLQQADAIRWRLGVRNEVRILMSPKVATPMAGGLWRPVILLPSDAEGWSPERRAVVLTHELVHVRRRDALRQVVGRTAVALYWFHPLSWLAWRAATIAGERSCDEGVLALGTRPSEYARHLFSLASGTADGRALLALPMVQRSQLENRIMSILKRHRPRYSLARTLAALAGMGVAGTLIACANPVPRDPAAQPAPGRETTDSSDVQGQNRVIAAPSPEPTTVARPAAEPAPAAPEVLRDASPQAFECSFRGSMVLRRRQEDEWTLQRRVDGIRLCMSNHGFVTTASDATAIESVDDDAWLVLESEAERLHRLAITLGPSGLEYEWSIDGRSEEFDAEAQEWRDLMLTVMGGYMGIQDVLAEAGSIRSEIGSHQRHVGRLRREIGAHQRHVASLRHEIGAHQRHVAGRHGQVMAPEALADVMSRVSAQVEFIANQHATTREAMEAARQAWATAEVRVALESARASLARVDIQEVVEAARQASRTGGIEEAERAAVQAAAEALERLEMQGTMADLAESSEALSAAAVDWTTLADELEEIERDLASRRVQLEREAAALEREVTREIEDEIDESDAGEWIRELQAQIEEYDLDGKIAEIEAQIDEYDLDAKIRELEAQIEELDTDRRADEIERSIQDDIAALRRIIG